MSTISPLLKMLVIILVTAVMILEVSYYIKQFIQSTRNGIFNKTFNDYFVTTNIKFQAAPVGQNDEFLKVVEQIRKVSASIGPSKVSKYHCFNSKLAKYLKNCKILTF